jgi:hypothetical protein
MSESLYIPDQAASDTLGRSAAEAFRVCCSVPCPLWVYHTGIMRSNLVSSSILNCDVGTCCPSCVGTIRAWHHGPGATDGR